MKSDEILLHLHFAIRKDPLGEAKDLKQPLDGAEILHPEYNINQGSIIKGCPINTSSPERFTIRKVTSASRASRCL